MPVETGMIPDEDAPAETPPGEIAGIEPIAAEPDPANTDVDARPFVTVRERVFHLRSEIPGMLLLDLADKQSKIRGGTAPTAEVQAKLFGALSRSITMLVVEEERDDFIEFLIETDPVIGLPELVGKEGGIVGDMMAAVTGRPTPSA